MRKIIPVGIGIWALLMLSLAYVFGYSISITVYVVLILMWGGWLLYHTFHQASEPLWKWSLHGAIAFVLLASPFLIDRYRSFDQGVYELLRINPLNDVVPSLSIWGDLIWIIVSRALQGSVFGALLWLVTKPFR